jgi:hypothetical protein
MVYVAGCWVVIELLLIGNLGGGLDRHMRVNRSEQCTNQ